MPEDKQTPSAPFLLLAAGALLIGLYARFKGLGFAPIAIDEYYLSRAIDGVLKYGVPAYDCGGFYQRGLLIQYLAAGLRLLGLSAELAPRLIAAVASVISLPAVFLIGRRFLTANGALVAVSILAVSLWEIEVARFGRFYAPFIAVFMWYLVYFLKYTIDRQRSAWRAMLLLTVMAGLIWEGAIFLALVNLVPALLVFAETNRLEKEQWQQIAMSVLLLVVLYFAAAIDFRYASEIPPFPTGYSEDLVESPIGRLQLISITPRGAWADPLWSALSVGALLLGIPALRSAWQWRDKPLVMLGMLVMLAGAFIHQIVIVLSVPLVLALLGQLSGRDIKERSTTPFVTCIALITLLWVLYGYATTDWSQITEKAGSTSNALAIFAYQYVRFPTLISDVVRPFARAVPMLGLVLVAGLAVVVAWLLAAGKTLRTAERLMTVVMVVLLLAVGFTDPPREETRYVVFLHPLSVLITVAAMSHLVSMLAPNGMKTMLLTAIAVAGLHAATEDFSLQHMLTIDSPETTFRRGMKVDMQAHLGEARDDFRAVATWLDSNASSHDDMVINGVHGIDYYFEDLAYFFAESTSPTFLEWSCRKGAVDRWTNLPLIYTINDLKAKTASARTAYLVTWTFETPKLLAALSDRRARVTLVEGLIAVVAMDGAR